MIELTPPESPAKARTLPASVADDVNTGHQMIEHIFQVDAVNPSSKLRLQVIPPSVLRQIPPTSDAARRIAELFGHSTMKLKNPAASAPLARQLILCPATASMPIGQAAAGIASPNTIDVPPSMVSNVK